MKNCQHILLSIALIMALNLMLPAAPPKPGYLNRGTPFGLRKMDRTRPPVYSLPPLKITPDPQPRPLTTSNPALPLNPAAIPSMTVPPTQQFRMEARTIVLPTPAMISPFGQPQATGVNSATGAFLNPQILRYFNVDANGTYQSRILLNGSSLYTLPSLNPLSQRGSSATFQVK